LQKLTQPCVIQRVEKLPDIDLHHPAAFIAIICCQNASNA